MTSPQRQGQRILPYTKILPLHSWKIWCLDKMIYVIERFGALMYLWCKRNTVEVEFTIDREQLKQFKRGIEQELTTVDWVSSYEVIMGCAAAAHCHANGQASLNFPVAINLRERASPYKDNYFGNCLTTNADSKLNFRADGETPRQRMVAVTEQLHQSLRAHLALEDKMIETTATTNLREAGLVSISYLMGYAVFRWWIYLNNWTDCPWFSITMGGTPVSVFGSFGSGGRMIGLRPCTPKSYRLVIPVRASQASKLKAFVESNELPFVELVS